MNIKFKRFIAGLSATAVVLSFVGCGNSSTDNDDDDDYSYSYGGGNSYNNDSHDGVVGNNDYDGDFDENDCDQEWNNYVNDKMDQYDYYNGYGY